MDLAPSFSKAPTVETEAEGVASLDLGDATLFGTGKASKERKEGPMTIIKTQAKVSKARASVVESPKWVTRLAMKAKVVVAKVKRTVAPMTDAGEGGQAGPSIAQENAPTVSENRSLGVEKCLKFWMTPFFRKSRRRH